MSKKRTVKFIRGKEQIMEKNDFEAIELGKGAVRVYDLGAARLLSYMSKEV